MPDQPPKESAFWKLVWRIILILIVLYLLIGPLFNILHRGMKESKWIPQITDLNPLPFFTWVQNLWKEIMAPPPEKATPDGAPADDSPASPSDKGNAAPPPAGSGSPTQSPGGSRTSAPPPAPSPSPPPSPRSKMFTYALGGIVIFAVIVTIFLAYTLRSHRVKRGGRRAPPPPPPEAADADRRTGGF